jgi:hypothetical protein
MYLFTLEIKYFKRVRVELCLNKSNTMQLTIHGTNYIFYLFLSQRD